MNNQKLSGRIFGSFEGSAIPISTNSTICPNRNLPFPVQSNNVLQNMSPEEYAITRPYINPFFMHSGAECAPTIKEEGPLAIQGNVGVLIDRSPGGFPAFGMVGGVANRSAKTRRMLQSGKGGVTTPELYGISSLGLENPKNFDKNIYTIAGDGTRTANAGRTSSMGCGEWSPEQVPNVGTCALKNFL